MYAPYEPHIASRHFWHSRLVRGEEQENNSDDFRVISLNILTGMHFVKGILTKEIPIPFAIPPFACFRTNRYHGTLQVPRTPFLYARWEFMTMIKNEWPRWSGVFSAVTTKMMPDGSLDIPALGKHFEWQIESGVNGLVVLGSLGENATLTPHEKQQVIKVAILVSNGSVPVLSGVVETSTLAACRFVEAAAKNGADGFMLLPAMIYPADAREAIRHLRTVAAATDRPIMLYNNPVAYGIDITPAMFAELADEPKFVAIKESSDNVRRITDILNLVSDRYQIFTGVDDLALESLVLGAAGWVAGLVCAFPKETVALYRLIKAGRMPEAIALYRWFTPLLHLDVSLKFVQNIKLAEAIVGCGTEHVRMPRLPLVGNERERVESIVRHALATRPQLPNI